jgi:hypothetical protein
MTRLVWGLGGNDDNNPDHIEDDTVSKMNKLQIKLKHLFLPASASGAMSLCIQESAPQQKANG